MKQVILLLAAAVGFMACKSGDKKKADTGISADSEIKRTKDSIIKANNEATAQQAADTNNTSVQWLDSTFLDLGKQKEGKPIEITFRFKNTGNKNLVIQSVTAGCGCTIPETPQQPFAPGETGTIKAKFNGIGNGETRKDVNVTANIVPATQTLTFRMELVKK